MELVQWYRFGSVFQIGLAMSADGQMVDGTDI